MEDPTLLTLDEARFLMMISCNGFQQTQYVCIAWLRRVGGIQNDYESFRRTSIRSNGSLMIHLVHARFYYAGNDPASLLPSDSFSSVLLSLCSG